MSDEMRGNQANQVRQSKLKSDPDAIRLYGTVRTAHLERFKQMMPARVMYSKARYDYDESLSSADDLPMRKSRLGVIRHLLRTHYRVVEINEPLLANRWPDMLLQVVAVRLRSLLSRKRSRIVTYCIGHSDPAEEEVEKRPWIPLRAAKLVTWACSNLLVRSIDRVAFGTEGSYELYCKYVGTRALRKKSAMFEALPAPCTCNKIPHDESRSTRLIFVGAFQNRKGIRELMAAWDVLHESNTQLRLHLIGKGDLLEEVRHWAKNRAEVLLDVDPPRAEIHRSLRNSRALVLLSQPTGAWREQVGLPIVEGLSHGLEIVATSETGLARWLTDHGHVVIPATSTAEQTAAALHAALTGSRDAKAILASLPTSDQRIEADRWMLSPRYALHEVNRVAVPRSECQDPWLLDQPGPRGG